MARPLCALVLLAALATPVRAQVCLGGVDFREGSGALQLGVLLGGGARGAGIGARFGAEGGFGGGTIYRLTDDVSNWTMVTLRGGASIPFERDQAAFCPVLEMSAAALPADNGTVVARSVIGGLAVGAVLSITPRESELLPFMVLGYSTVGVEGAVDGFDISTSADGFVGTIGAGLRFSRVGAITAALSAALAGDAEPVLEIGFLLQPP